MNHLRNVFENLSKENNWKFFYGRPDFLNLVNAENSNEEQWYFYCAPLQYSINFDENNQFNNIYQWAGAFQILTKSQLDELYDNTIRDDVNRVDYLQSKFEKHIYPKFIIFDDIVRKYFYCNDIELVSWNVTEFVNIFDDNFCGIGVEFTLNQYV